MAKLSKSKAKSCSVQKNVIKPVLFGWSFSKNTVYGLKRLIAVRLRCTCLFFLFFFWGGGGGGWEGKGKGKGKRITVFGGFG